MELHSKYTHHHKHLLYQFQRIPLHQNYCMINAGLIHDRWQMVCQTQILLAGHLTYAQEWIFHFNQGSELFHRSNRSSTVWWLFSKSLLPSLCTLKLISVRIQLVIKSVTCQTSNPVAMSLRLRHLRNPSWRDEARNKPLCFVTFRHTRLLQHGHT